MIALRKDLILRRPQSGRLEGRTRLIQLQTETLPALAGWPPGGYNARMRRPTRLGLAVAVLLVAICGAYGAFWFVVAGRLEDGVTQWAQSLRAQNLDLSWRSIRVGGFPLAFR